MKNKILESVEKYYSDKITTFGDSPNGVDWNSIESQYLRFDQLSKVISEHSNFTILDYGCGSGEYVKYLDSKMDDEKYSYIGYDISNSMLNLAREKFKFKNNVFFDSIMPSKNVDFTIASGIFNVRLDIVSNLDWNKYIIETLNSINEVSSEGFSFNALTKYSDKEYMKDYLYYADPLALFDYCKLNFSKNVALLHDYNLFEFTIIVRK
jgi:SAM-dependent methyltransferase